jgi:hypothetical protein
VIMPPGIRRFALTAHVASSVGSLGAVAGFLALAMVGLMSRDAMTVRAAYVAMEPIALLAIVPLALGALLTGLVQSLGTSWGLFRHYWVLLKLFVTLFVAGVLMLQLPLIGYVAAAAAVSELGEDLRHARLSLVLHAGGGLVVLIVPVVLSIYKPRGLTRYGLAKQRS